MLLLGVFAKRPVAVQCGYCRNKTVHRQWFEDVAGNVQVERVNFVAVFVGSSHHENRKGTERRVLPDLFQEFDAAHFRHVQVQQYYFRLGILRVFRAE
ncbi:hypothetical protein D3C86_2048860 [compost metagenome]